MNAIPAKALLNELSEQLQVGFDQREAGNLAMELLSHYHGLDRMKVAMNEPCSADEEIKAQVQEAITRLLNHEPLQHILGGVEFYGLTLKSDTRALIPRPETEELVDWVVKESAGQAFKILDIGTGTGCIPIALKKNLPLAVLSGLDVSEAALDLARENALLNQADVKWHHLDILEAPLPDEYDVLVSNPPYIPANDKAQMAPNVLDHEPGLALFVSNDSPLIFYQRIAALGLEGLKEGGALYFEIHEGYGREMIKMLEGLGYVNVTLRQDLQGKDRMIKATRP